jgi:hypothetical protein
METGHASAKGSGYLHSTTTNAGVQHLASVTQGHTHPPQAALLVEGDEESTKRDELASTVLAR